MELRDTSPKALERYRQSLKALTPAERIRIAVRLWEAGNSLQRAAMRQRYPDADDDEIAFRIGVTRFGPDLAREAWRRG